MQNGLRHRLPPAYISKFPDGVALAYAIIPEISSLTPSMEEDVRCAFASSLSTLWKVLTGIAGVGLLSSMFMHEVPLHTAVDQEWDLTTVEHNLYPEHARE